MNKAVFLDRDGTINEEVNYLSNSGDLKLYPDTLPALQTFKSLGFLNIIITNQSGIARGYFSEDDLNKIHTDLKKLLTDTKTGSALIDDIFFSPYHPDGVIEKYKLDSEDRKPGTGMIRKAGIKFNINNGESYFIGDSFADMQCAENAGLKKIMVKTGYGIKDHVKCVESGIIIDYLADDLYHASEYIKNSLTT
ncbi:MAG: HAD family hydrolase [Ignavibacteria bacterium]|jgi:D,D-heptose 1,7-bisphosphate phosphatase|nr:HAD family hydrolase [Ignavibacteria bacterium]